MIDAAELARLRRIADATNSSITHELIDALEKAWGERDIARESYTSMSKAWNSTVDERDSARALTAALPFLALRPAPSLSDEEVARKLWGMPKDGVTLIGEGRVRNIMAVLAAVRAEATLAGAAAEREACAKMAEAMSGLWSGATIAAAIRARKP